MKFAEIKIGQLEKYAEQKITSMAALAVKSHYDCRDVHRLQDQGEYAW